MPLYEYSCEKCHTVIEKIQKFSDPPLLVCEQCGGPLVKLMGKPALQFKGSGFYITDYVKKSGEEGSNKKEPKPEPASTESSSSSSPSPAAPAPAAPAPAASE
jgi:putative FmdB family regulatory protein